MSDTRTTTIESTKVMGFREAKDAHKEQMLTYAVQWAKSLKLMDAERKTAGFQRDYLDQVCETFCEVIEDAPEDVQKECLEKIGTMRRLVGKVQDFDGKPFQPIVELPDVRTESGATPSAERIGIERLLTLQKRAINLKNDCLDMEDVRPSLVWKQKFYRYGYNHDVEPMKKYHTKISDYEAERLDKIMEQDADGTLGQVVFHNTEEITIGDKSEAELGRTMMADTRRIGRTGDGQFVREYSDRIKNAYEIRCKLIEMCEGFNEVPKAERKLYTFEMTEQVNTVDTGTMPNLI
tara:strand:+ start:20575 stop:21453 length:879 start_codon:yes stop_codon:yes gene_type:complete